MNDLRTAAIAFLNAAEEYRIHSELLFDDDPIEITVRMLQTRNLLREALMESEIPPTPEDLGTATNDYDVVMPEWTIVDVLDTSYPNEVFEHFGDMLTDCDPGDEDDTTKR